MAGRDRTCGAPRFGRALYPLSYGHMTWARLESNQRPLACKASALPFELHARELRDKESNLDLHVQSVVSYRLDDPGTAPRLSPPSNEKVDAGARPSAVALARSPEAERCFPSHSPALRPWIAGRDLRLPRASSYVEELWSPTSTSILKNSQAKAHALLPAFFPAPSARVFLSQAGPRFTLRSCSS